MSLFHKALQQLCYDKYTYRNIEGENNNQTHKDWGKAGQQLLRIAPPAYEDGISQPRGYLGNGKSSLPNPRSISNEFCKQDHKRKNQKGASAWFWLWGQFIDHDLDLSPPGDEPFNIHVPRGDAWFDPKGTGKVTITLNRTQYNPSTGSSAEKPREQITNITAYIDASGVYGSNRERANYVRSFKDGKLKLSEDGLPPLNNGTQEMDNPTGKAKFVCGDNRANEQVGLTCLHTLFIREHNWWAHQIKTQRPALSDEEIYQRAKMMVEAEIQQVTYGEFLPILLGCGAIPHYRGYNNSVNSGVTTEFSTCAYRLGHSLVGDEILRLDENYTQIPAGNLPLKDVFFDSSFLLDKNNGGIEPVLRGFAKDKSEALDIEINDDLRNFLFGPPGKGGHDLASLNIQRGRDHGIPDINTIRKHLGLKPYTCWCEWISDLGDQYYMEQLYGNPGKVDLWVGGLLEKLFKDALVGETFFHILRDQFVRSRDGDRYWYQNRLTREQQKIVQLTKLSDIIKRNTIIKNIQKNVFLCK